MVKCPACGGAGVYRKLGQKAMSCGICLGNGSVVDATKQLYEMDMKREADKERAKREQVTPPPDTIVVMGAAQLEFMSKVLTLCGLTPKEIDLVSWFKLEAGVEQLPTLTVERLVKVDEERGLV